MNWGMEVLSPASYLSTASWLIDETKSTKWTHAENKAFENALAIYDEDTPDRWLKVAAAIPGKTVGDVMRQYKELEDDVSYIEAGLVDDDADPSCYNYRSNNNDSSGFTLEWVNHNSDYDGYGYKQGYSPRGKRGPGARSADQERKKGVPWTEEEHKLFLMGLKKYGKGDWRNISRNFVVTRTPTQVASHAQKYFIRQQLSGGKDKRRASIHDITTSTLDSLTSNLSPEDKSLVDSPDNHSSNVNHHHRPSRHQNNQMNPVSGVSTTTPSFQWNQQGSIAFNPMRGGNAFMLPYGVNSYAMKMQGQNAPMGHHQNMVLQMQAPHCSTLPMDDGRCDNVGVNVNILLS